MSAGVKHRGVRVIAGSARGRRLAVPAGDDVRPTKDMVREAVFSALRRARRDRRTRSVLDLYAGTGALGIEALSRGAARAVLVERDGARVGVDRARTSRRVGFADRGAGRARRRRPASSPRRAPREAPFDLVFADPPYDAADDDVAAVFDRVSRAPAARAGRDVVLERPAGAGDRAAAGLRSRVGAHVRRYARRLPRALTST